MTGARRNFLVTGGAGFVGRNVVARLAADFPDAEIFVIDDLSTGLEPLNWPEIALTRGPEVAVGESFSAESGALVRFIRSDAMTIFLSELGKIPAVTPEPLPHFERAYHLASIVGGRAVIEGDPLAVASDLAIDSLFFLWASRAGKPDRIMYASSSAAYPVDLQDDGKDVALAEEMLDFDRIGRPDFTYGWSKVTGEYLSRVASSSYGLKVAAIRPFSGYGEHQEPVYPVPAIALRVAARRDPLLVWGSGKQSRDFVHIDDCVEAIERAMMRIEDGTAVNIGSGEPTSFLELAALFADIAGYRPQISGRDGRPVGVARRYCDPTMMRTLLDFKPQISLREGMGRVLAEAERRLAAGATVPD